jgi:hypothetical protein
VNKIATDAAESDWVEANSDVVERAFASYMHGGEWPPVERLQRDLDRARSTSDVRDALRHMPRLPGEMRAWEPTVVAIPLRLLRFVPSAAPVLEVCLAIAQRAVEAYDSDADPPTVTSKDLMDIVGVPYALHVFSGVGLPEQEDERQRRVQRAGQLLSGSAASPLGSGSYGNDAWQFEVDGRMARRYRDVQTIDDYFDRQAEIVAEYARTIPGALPPEAARLTVFVLMPFGPDWSKSVYAMTRRAAATVASADAEVDVYRADDIVASGKITDQITHAIQTADVIVADITDTNPNVMWELGFAQALGKPVVILNQDVAASPFDLRDWRQVAYRLDTIESSEPRVAEHLRSALSSPSAAEPSLDE